MEIEGAEIDSVLQVCLDEIANGQETLDSAIRKHPQLEADLRRELEAAVWFQSLRESLAVRPDFMRRSSRHLYTQIRKENPHKQLFKRRQALNRWERKPVVQVALAILLVLALLANTNSLAAAALAAGPGDQFYPIKTSLERVRLALAASPVKEAELSAQQAQQRLVELTGLVLEGDLDPLAITAAAYDLKVQRALSALESVERQDPAEASRLAQALQRNVFDQAGLLALLAQSLPDSSRAYIENTLKVSEMGQAAVQRLLVKEIPGP
jgi:hypothetical protein